MKAVILGSSRGPPHSRFQARNCPNCLRSILRGGRPLSNALRGPLSSSRAEHGSSTEVRFKIDRRFHLEESWRRQAEREEERKRELTTCPLGCLLEIRNLAHFEQVLEQLATEPAPGPAEPPSPSSYLTESPSNAFPLWLERLVASAPSDPAGAAAARPEEDPETAAAARVLEGKVFGTDGAGDAPGARAPPEIAAGSGSPTPPSIVVLEFYNTACGSCPEITERFSRICKTEGLSGGDTEAAGRIIFAKHNIYDEFDDRSDLSELYRVRMAPAFIVFVNGTPRHRQHHRNLGAIERAIEVFRGVTMSVRA